MEFYRGKENKDQKRSSSDPGRKFAVRATYKNLFVHDGWLYFGSGKSRLLDVGRIKFVRAAISAGRTLGSPGVHGGEVVVRYLYTT